MKAIMNLYNYNNNLQPRVKHIVNYHEAKWFGKEICNIYISLEVKVCPQYLEPINLYFKAVLFKEKLI